MSDIERCERCGHAWDEHDAFNDCHHLDGRTETGYCNCSERAAASGTQEEAP